MLATVLSASLQGVHALPVEVEVNSGESGDPRLVLVGLPDVAVRESQDRVSSALANSGFRMNRTRTTINLAPGNMRKEGPIYDLPLAMGLLLATQQVASGWEGEFLLAGELALSGNLRPIRGALAFAMLARRMGKRGILLPVENAEEASLVEGVEVYPVSSLNEAVRFVRGECQITPRKPIPFEQRLSMDVPEFDFSEVKGQYAVRRAVEVAVAGSHNLSLIGPPGSGKSMIAKRIPSILPLPGYEEYLEILSVQSAAGKTFRQEELGPRRPFRCPHHTISDIGLLGGGAVPTPGEISLAHRGVLFLDELPEFRRSTLEVMRQPLEDRQVTISRSAGKLTFPSEFMLVAAMNPCPCGYLGDPQQSCRCRNKDILRYRGRISGPLLDRIDIHVEAPAVRLQELRGERPAESSAAMRKRIEQARLRQKKRLHGERILTNSQMRPAELRRYCRLSPELGGVLEGAMERLKLSGRAYDRILKVTRTIADLEGSEEVELAHLLEAIQYRSLDRQVDSQNLA